MIRSICDEKPAIDIERQPPWVVKGGFRGHSRRLSWEEIEACKARACHCGDDSRRRNGTDTVAEVVRKEDPTGGVDHEAVGVGQLGL